MEEVRLTWGHPIKNPEGVEIRLPSKAFKTLRILGLFETRNGKPTRTSGLFKISSSVYEILHPDFDCITDKLSRTLGSDCKGPEWVECHCGKCKKLHEETDKVKLPWKMLRR